MNPHAKALADLQREDGGWGHFHTLAASARPPITEQALRRLGALGLTRRDPPVRRALAYLDDCLAGRRSPPDGREKVLNWDAFERLMFAAWIRRFDPGHQAALAVGREWADFVEAAAADGTFDRARYDAAYRARIPVLNRGERILRPANFHLVSLLRGLLSPTAEVAYVRHVYEGADGLYLYGRRLAEPPAEFAARATVGYLAALELLAAYARARPLLAPAAAWLEAHRDGDGGWDLGPKARDGTYFPVSASWRKAEDRKRDCTARVGAVLAALTST